MVKDRLTAYLKHKKMGMREFARLCDVGISVLSRISEATAPKTLRKIEEKSDLNTDWLMYGEGEMIKHNNGSGDLSVGGNISGISGNFGSINSGIDKSISISLPKSGSLKIINEKGEERTIEIGNIGDNAVIKEIENLRELILVQKETILTQKELISFQKDKIAELECLLKNNM